MSFRRIGRVIGAPLQLTRRTIHSDSNRDMKVAIIGGSGGIGQPLSLLLKLEPFIAELHVHDVVRHHPGVMADLSHIETSAKVKSYVGGPDQVAACVRGCDVVVVPAGIPRKPGMSRDDLFRTNAGIVRDISKAVVTSNHTAVLAIITNPINSVVPIACGIYATAGQDPTKVVGVTTLDVVRANTMIAEMKCLKAEDVECPVVGGHAGSTIIPLLSHCTPAIEFSEAEQAQLTKAIQDAGTEVVKAKAGAGSATLSMAFAAKRLVNAVMRGLRGESNVVECAFGLCDVMPEVKYFACPMLFGKKGVEKHCGLGKLNKFEKQALKSMLPTLKKNVAKGENFK